jgi:hypothetical protein
MRGILPVRTPLLPQHRDRGDVGDLPARRLYLVVRGQLLVANRVPSPHFTQQALAFQTNQLLPSN